jgi:hypothetical protein
VNRREAADYAQRHWSAPGASAVQYWAERFRAAGWRVVWDAAQALAAHVRAVQRDYPREAEVRVPVASPEDVLIMKVLAGRPKDDEDVAAILAAASPGAFPAPARFRGRSALRMSPRSARSAKYSSGEAPTLFPPPRR